MVMDYRLNEALNMVENSQQGAKVMRLDDFGPLHHNSDEVQMILDTLHHWAEQYQLTSGKSMILPSQETLAGAFQVSEQTLHDALVELKHQGFDVFIPGRFGPITLWRSQNNGGQNHQEHNHKASRFWQIQQLFQQYTNPAGNHLRFS